MNKLLRISGWTLAAACAALSSTARAQQSFYSRFRSDNASMAAVQPSWMGPVIQSDARLGQAVRFSVSNAICKSSHPISYGNGHGFSVIIDRRFQLDFDSPALFRNHSAAFKDGFGNAGTQLKWRIASGNAQHGNFIVSALLYYGFAPRAIQNGAFSSTLNPTLAAGRAFSRLALISNLGGVLPTRDINQQGRSIAWNTTAQLRLNPHVLYDLENNAAFNFAGPFDGKTQNFLTPAAYYILRRREWEPNHSVVVFDCGFQTATSRFHQYNHNLVTEMRLFF